MNSLWTWLDNQIDQEINRQKMPFLYHHRKTMISNLIESIEQQIEYLKSHQEQCFSYEEKMLFAYKLQEINDSLIRVNALIKTGLEGLKEREQGL